MHRHPPPFRGFILALATAVCLHATTPPAWTSYQDCLRDLQHRDLSHSRTGSSTPARSPTRPANPSWMPPATRCWTPRAVPPARP